ncbi:MAG: response regulator, partial [Psychrosphaera sp.]|nr:response regulator [Psychrosphaera sp.]
MHNKMPEDICVQGDQQRLQQVMQNLLGNAIKFTQSGFITVSANQVDDRIEISVQDSGEGIAPEHQQRIFEAFEQGDGSSTRAQGGTGLGLSITKQLVELHGGQLSVVSNLGEGSTFSFSLLASQEAPENTQILIPKLYNNQNSTAVEKSLVDQTELSGGEDFNIMVVDDEPLNLQIVLNHLAKSACNITPCQSGTEALALIEQQKPDLVLLDVMMPNLDGYQTCRQIRQHYSTYQLPVIFLTARNQLKDLVEAFDSGGNDYLSKPFFKDELLARVQVQIELSMQRKRISKLRHLANNISQYKS